MNISFQLEDRLVPQESQKNYSYESIGEERKTKIKIGTENR